MAAFSQKDREDGEEGMKASREGTPIWLRSPQGWEEGKREKGETKNPGAKAVEYIDTLYIPMWGSGIKQGEGGPACHAKVRPDGLKLQT